MVRVSLSFMTTYLYLETEDDRYLSVTLNYLKVRINKTPYLLCAVLWLSNETHSSNTLIFALYHTSAVRAGSEGPFTLAVRIRAFPEWNFVIFGCIWDWNELKENWLCFTCCIGKESKYPRDNVMYIYIMYIMLTASSDKGRACTALVWKRAYSSTGSRPSPLIY